MAIFYLEPKDGVTNDPRWSATNLREGCWIDASIEAWQNRESIMRKKQAARQHFTAALALAALVLAIAVGDARASETLFDTVDPDFLVLNPEGE